MAQRPGAIEAEVAALVRARLGVAVVALRPLAADLGPRRFFRVLLDGEPRSLVARVEAPEDPAGRPAGTAPEPPLEPLRSFLEAAGLPVPARYGGDAARGIDLLEDLGTASLADVAPRATAEERVALYREACALVPRLQALEDPGGQLPAFRRHLDRELVLYKADLFARFGLPLALAREPRPAEREAVRGAFGWIADALAAAPLRLAHRDFQSRNLLVRPRPAHAPEHRPRIAMIDLQGAFLAPPEYDLVCLLRDSYVELPEAEVREHLERVRPALPDPPDPQTFARRFDLLTLVRKGKDLARFLSAAGRRGDRRFAAYAPATVRALQRAAGRTQGLDPRVDRLAEWIRALPGEGEP